jgi:hypothetical protein
VADVARLEAGELREVGVHRLRAALVAEAHQLA